MLLITAVKRRRLSSLYADYIIVGGEGECCLMLIFSVLLELLALFFISGKFIVAVDPPQVHDQSLRGW